MNVLFWLKTAKTKISSLDAELILAHTIKQNRIFLHAHPTRKLTKTEQKTANKLLARRENHEPLAYLLGRKDFYGRSFSINKNVLIPRPETETLIELAKTEFKNHKNPKILDLGTGSGCIATTLAKELPNSDVTAVDICKKALKVAEQNANTHRVQNRITFLKSDLLSAPELENQTYNLICANLPYVDPNWSWNSPELAHEPKKALYAKNQGLELIFQLLDQAPKHLMPQATLLIESDTTQHPQIKKYAQSQNFKHTQTSSLILSFRISS